MVGCQPANLGLLLWGISVLSLPLSAEDGQLRFKLDNTQYSTQQAMAVLKTVGDKKRLFVAVKDREQRFMFALTADLNPADTAKPLQLTTENGAVSLSLRTPQGVLAVLPRYQLAKNTPDLYTERIEKVTDEWEEEPVPATDAQTKEKRRLRRKVKVEYQKVKPRWHNYTREQRIESGEGIIDNKAFENTHFVLKLTPIVEQGKLVGYEGNFAGVARFARGLDAAETKAIQNGYFHVRLADVR